LIPAPPPLTPERLRALVFDLDGTLVDSYRAIALGVNAAREAFALAPLAIEDVKRRVGHGLEDLMEDVLGPARAERGAALFRATYERIYLDATEALPDAVEAIAGLRARGYRLSVASNKPARFSAPILERLGMLASFDTVEGPETAGATKPDPRMIGRCLATMGVGKEHAAYVGDMTLDVESAARAGVASILVAGGSSSDAELRATGQRVLTGLRELLDLLSGPR
jgi:phosphoglycolate phosphatase